MRRGICLCGAVDFTIDAVSEDPITCHCKQCRQQSGHYFSAVAAPKKALRFSREDGLAWYRSSEFAARGFCRDCGSTLFWRTNEGPTVMVAMAALDSTEGLALSGHYWVDFKGDYYDIADGLPQHKGETS
ncbi:GFA family protein [uncultured Roseovarius sp.]|uniref:GFA family protein n=1 Tax=uncultured Roseovarius sp. TaxID=293344 RepID=UPI0026341AC7|nr:GFA family protein [uncultured Roseovarius sp.]